MKAKDTNKNSDFKVQRYTSSNELEWNDFVSKSKNATFLFHRDFMDYHQDRFEDFSLMVFKNDKLIALLPANKVGNEIHSHQGLSYGGLLLQSNIKFRDVLKCFKEVLDFLHHNNIEMLHLKFIPKIYHKLPCDELDYLMFILKAEVIKKETLSVIIQFKETILSKDRIQGIKRANKFGLSIIEENNFNIFWERILMKNLKSKYDTEPVHSLNEIENLKSNFPKQIRQFNVYHKDKLVAGTTIFETENVAHCQYISADENKNTLGSLDFLHHHLIKNVFKDKQYYDFGSSNENDGRQINEGLQYWKEGFGARTIIHDFYSIKTENYVLLNKVLK